MPPLEPKTIATIIAGIVLAYSELRNNGKTDAVRNDVSAGTIEYVNAQLDERDHEISDLKMQIAVLQTKIDEKRR